MARKQTDSSQSKQSGTPRRRSLNTSRYAAAAIAISSLTTQQAHGFCRATSCNAAEGDVCTPTDENCMYEGAPLGWLPGTTLNLGVDEASANAVDLQSSQVLGALNEASSAWTKARCSGDEPASIFLNSAEDEASTEDFDVLLTFRSLDWPYEPMAVAKTTLTFGLDSGLISSAIIEMNAVSYVFSIDDEPGRVPLSPVLTHELGHVLGLDHTLVTDATMQAVTSSAWSNELLSLEQDDVDGMCSLYPPASDPNEYDVTDDVAAQTEPDDEARADGCSFSPTPIRAHSAISWLIAACLTGAVRLRRREP